MPWHRTLFEAFGPRIVRLFLAEGPGYSAAPKLCCIEDSHWTLGIPSVLYNRGKSGKGTKSEMSRYCCPCFCFVVWRSAPGCLDSKMSAIFLYNKLLQQGKMQRKTRISFYCLVDITVPTLPSHLGLEAGQNTGVNMLRFLVFLSPKEGIYVRQEKRQYHQETRGKWWQPKNDMNRMEWSYNMLISMARGIPPNIEDFRGIAHVMLYCRKSNWGVARQFWHVLKLESCI